MLLVRTIVSPDSRAERQGMLELEGIRASSHKGERPEQRRCCPPAFAPPGQHLYLHVPAAAKADGKRG